MTFDEMFMSMAFLTAMKSKDQNTHCGAVIVGPDNEIRSTGYNSFPRGLNDNIAARQLRPEKYLWIEHAERNAIYNAARMGTSIIDCTIYCTGYPCMDCARGIVQSGIKEVVFTDTHHANQKWAKDSLENVPTLFKETGVQFRIYEGPIITKVVRKLDGRIS